jgi:uncharacterized membrane protein YqjE
MDHLAALASSVLRLLYSRIELAGIELAIERDSLMERAEATLIGLVSAGLAGLSLILMAVVALPEKYQVVALGLLALLFSAVALIAWLRRRRLAAGTMFPRITQQFRQDCEALEAIREERDDSDQADADLSPQVLP